MMKKEQTEENIQNTLKKRKSLGWSMIRMLLFGWFFPLIIMIFMTHFWVAGKINNQVEKTVESSANKATEILEIQLDASATASKNASYLPVIRNVYEAYQTDGDKRNFKGEILGFLHPQYRYDKNIRAAILVFPEYRQEKFFTFNNSKNGTYKDIEFFYNYVEEDLVAYMDTLGTNTELWTCEEKIYMVRNLVDSKFKPYAVFAMELDKDSIVRSIYSIWGYEDVTFYKNGEIFVSAGVEGEVAYNETISKKLSKNSLVFEKGKGESSYIYKRMTAYPDKYDIAVRLNNSIIYSETQTVGYVFVTLFFFMIPLIYMILTFFYRRVTKPVQEMVQAFNVVREGTFGIQIAEEANSEEFHYMKESFNHMSTQLQNQFEKIYKEEIALRDARIMALQSQINPHFLNNTLEIINWEARLNENYKVSQMIEALSTMLEASMNRRAQPFNTVAEEMIYVDAYLYIISQRFGDKFSYHQEVDESLLNCKIPRLIVQPIIENAVEHGMDIAKKGEVFLRLYQKEEGILCIEIEDNGTLTERDKQRIHRLLSEELNPLNEKHVSLGIRNVDRRLKILYGEEFGLFITNNKNNHTVSTILVKIGERTAQ